MINRLLRYHRQIRLLIQLCMAAALVILLVRLKVKFDHPDDVFNAPTWLENLVGASWLTLILGTILLVKLRQTYQHRTMSQRQVTGVERATNFVAKSLSIGLLVAIILTLVVFGLLIFAFSTANH